jgi:type II secretory pathway pseudopilin PulG
MIELVVVLAIALTMILFLIPPLLNYLTRVELEQSGRQAEIVLRKARQKAITLQTPVRVEQSADGLFAFADFDNDTTFNNDDEEIDTFELAPKVEWVSVGYTAVFRSDGSADAVGFFPMRNRDGAQLRVRVTSLATGNVKIEKLY